MLLLIDPYCFTAPSLSVQTSEVFTSIGQPTVLLCEAGGTPSPVVTWTKDGRSLTSPQYELLADNSLYIADTQLKDDGSYIVTAFNTAGTTEEMVKVTVLAPIPPDGELLRMGLVKGYHGMTNNLFFLILLSFPFFFVCVKFQSIVSLLSYSIIMY